MEFSLPSTVMTVKLKRMMYRPCSTYMRNA